MITINTESTTTTAHIHSKHHQQRSKYRLAATAQEKRLWAYASQYFKANPGAEGAKLPISTLLYRLRTLHTICELGLAVSLFDKPKFRNWATDGGGDVGVARTMLNLLPIIMLKEEEETRRILKDKDVAIIFDSTTIAGREYYAFVVKYLGNSGLPEQRLIELISFELNLDASELAGELLRLCKVLFILSSPTHMCLCQKFGITPNRVLAFVHDRAKTNGAAISCIEVNTWSLVRLDRVFLACV
jgi:hypothetical protein